MLDGYKDEESFKKLWDPILAFAIDHKAWIKQFWEFGGQHQVWPDGERRVDRPDLGRPARRSPSRRRASPSTSGGRRAPIEGAITWVDGISLLKSAKNTEQVYAFLEYLQTPEVSAQVAEGSGYNPVVSGADGHLSEEAKKIFADAYPGDSLKNLWPWPAEPT